MLITENVLKEIIKNYLFEGFAPEKDSRTNKVFYPVEVTPSGGKTYEGGFIGGDDKNGYYILIDDDESTSQLRVVNDKESNLNDILKKVKANGNEGKIKNLKDILKKKLTNKRIVFVTGAGNLSEPSGGDTEFNTLEAVDLAYNTIVDGGAAIASLFPGTAAAASSVNLSQAAKKLAQGKIVDATISALSSIPIAASGIAVLGNLAKNPATRKGMAEVLKNSPSIVKGLKDFNSTLDKNKLSITNIFKGVAKNAGKKESVAETMFKSIKELLEKIINEF